MVGYTLTTNRARSEFSRFLLLFPEASFSSFCFGTACLALGCILVYRVVDYETNLLVGPREGEEKPLMA